MTTVRRKTASIKSRESTAQVLRAPGPAYSASYYGLPAGGVEAGTDANAASASAQAFEAALDSGRFQLASGPEGVEGGPVHGVSGPARPGFSRSTLRSGCSPSHYGALRNAGY